MVYAKKLPEFRHFDREQVSRHPGSRSPADRPLYSVTQGLIYSRTHALKNSCTQVPEDGDRLGGNRVSWGCAGNRCSRSSITTCVMSRPSSAHADFTRECNAAGIWAFSRLVPPLSFARTKASNAAARFLGSLAGRDPHLPRGISRLIHDSLYFVRESADIVCSRALRHSFYSCPALPNSLGVLRTVANRRAQRSNWQRG